MGLLGLFGCRNKGRDLASSGSCGENLSWEYDRKTRTLTITGSGDMAADRFMWSDYPIDRLILPEGLTSISGEAFYSNHDLKGELKLPSTLKKICEFAF